MRDSVATGPTRASLPPRSQERYVFMSEHARGGLANLSVRMLERAAQLLERRGIVDP